MSLDAATPNPKVIDPGKAYGEYDYLANDIDKVLYDTSEGASIPYVGKTPYANLFDRARFWQPSDQNLMAVAAQGLSTGDTVSFENTNLLNFANTGTDEISILVMKPENIKGFDVTCREWYGGAENIPFGFMRPSDYISDYFIRVICVKGNWTNYPVLSSDAVWGKYFDKHGLLKDKINAFITAEGITYLGSWTGVIIPDFIDKQGNYHYIKEKVNAHTESSGLLMAVNEDAMQVISYDFNGMDKETGDVTGKGCWVFDYDNNNEGESEQGETENKAFIVDMVGHGMQNGFFKKTAWKDIASIGNNSARGKKSRSMNHINGKDGKNSSLLYPKYYFDLGVDTSTLDVYCLSLNGLDTTTKTDDDIAEKAHAKVVCYDGKNTADNGKVHHIYGVYDASTNRRIRGTESYVSISIDTFNNSSLVTDSIKNLIVCDVNGIETTKKVSDIISDTAAANHNLKLVQESIDNKKYVDVSLYYGNYATFINDTSTIQFYNVTVGVNNKDASIIDGGFITDADYDVSMVKLEPADMNPTECLMFAYDGNQYVYDTSNFQFYILAQPETPNAFGINFLSYNYVTTNVNEVVYDVTNAYYFNGKKIGSNDITTASICGSVIDTSLFMETGAPCGENTFNQFIVTNANEADYLSVGDLVNNITFYNNTGDATAYGVIPGLTKIVEKIFVNVNSANNFTYKGKTYKINVACIDGGLITTKSGKRGFYLYTAIDPVLIDGKYNQVTRQKPISDNTISKSLRFIPLKGLHISAKHRPGFDANGKINIEEGISKIYSMLEDDGIRRGLTNENMITYRYIVDSMSYGIEAELGGKVYLSRLADERGKCTALLNMPSKKQFQASMNPVFCDTYDDVNNIKPSFNTKYIPEGGNAQMMNSVLFSLPTEDDGSKFTATFFPNLIYNDGGKKVSVPPAADVCNIFTRKFQGGNPYEISAGRQGLIQNPLVIGVEFDADVTDRSYLEPMGVNTIIKEGNRIMVYGNQTCYQDILSDLNKLHVRENLNTLEIATEEVLKAFNFKYNNPQTRTQIVTNLTPICEAMKLSGAFEDYTITCDESNNTPDIIAADYGIVEIDVWCGHGMEKIVQKIKINRRDTLPQQ